MPAFIGRQEELQVLQRLQKQRIASLVILKGRQRIGKSRFVKEFAKDSLFYNFSGIPPTSNTTAQSQREEFARQLAEKVGLPSYIKGDDWGDLFTVLAHYVEKSRVVILLDEIAWMGNKDPDFLGKLKNAWDNQFSHNTQLMMILLF